MSIAPRLLLPAVALATVSLLGLSACGDDDNPTGGGGGTPQQQEAIKLVNEVVLPVIQTLTLQNYLNLGMPLQECTPLGICASGSAESCLGETGLTVTFSNCASNGQTVNGTLNILGTETGGNATFDMVIDGLSIAGSASYGFEGLCFYESFNQVTLMLDGETYSMFGSLEFCQPAAPGARPDQVAVPTGGFIQIFDASTLTYTNVDFYTEGELGDYFVYVNQGENVLVTCEGNIVSGAIDCYDPTDYEF